MTISNRIVGVQFDSVNPLPFTPKLQALYLTGRFAVKPVYGRGRVYIDVNGSNPLGAFWRDIETGDGDPSSFPGWLDIKHHAGQAGGGYCNLSTLPGMIREAGRRPWSLWLATLDGTDVPTALAAVAELPPNVTFVGIQAIPAEYLGFNADQTMIFDSAYWTGRHA